MRTITKRIQKRIDNGFTIDCPPHGTYYLLCPDRPHVWHKYVLGIKGECITRVWWPLVPIEVYAQYLEFKQEIHKLNIMKRFKTRRECYEDALLTGKYFRHGEPVPDGYFNTQDSIDKYSTEAPHPYEGWLFIIRVTPHESEKVQKKAFALGISWHISKYTEVRHTDSEFLFIDFNGMDLTHDDVAETFSPHTELTPQQFLDGDLPDRCGKITHEFSCYQLDGTQIGEKTDAYVTGSDEVGYIIIQTTDKLKTKVIPQEVHQYNIISEEEFKAKHPDKLKFKEWEVVEKGDDIKVGCLLFFKADLKAFLSVVDEIFLNKCDCRDVQRFLIDNRKQLGL